MQRASGRNIPRRQRPVNQTIIQWNRVSDWQRGCYTGQPSEWCWSTPTLSWYRPTVSPVILLYIHFISPNSGSEREFKTDTHRYTLNIQIYKYIRTHEYLGGGNWTAWHGRYTISLTRQIQSKLNFKLLHAFGPQNTEQIETKGLLTVFNRINVASFE